MKTHRALHQITISLFLLMICACSSWPEMTITPSHQIQASNIAESSGLVHSSKHPGIFWTHNDSGGDPELYPMQKDGTHQGLADTITIKGVENIDWEDIARYQGGLLIADLGNNANDRKDLRLYHIAEPDPTKDASVALLATYPITWPDQKAFPPKEKDQNFDCEAIYTIGKTIYFLSKNRGNTKAKLYSLENPKANSTNKPKLIGESELNAQVTAADATDDGKQVAILTYKGVWVYNRPKDGKENIFDWKISYKNFDARQVEAIAIHDKVLIITNEQGDIFHIPMETLTSL